MCSGFCPCSRNPRVYRVNGCRMATEMQYIFSSHFCFHCRLSVMTLSRTIGSPATLLHNALSIIDGMPQRRAARNACLAAYCPGALSHALFETAALTLGFATQALDELGAECSCVATPRLAQSPAAVRPMPAVPTRRHRPQLPVGCGDYLELPSPRLAGLSLSEDNVTKSGQDGQNSQGKSAQLVLSRAEAVHRARALVRMT